MSVFLWLKLKSIVINFYIIEWFKIKSELHFYRNFQIDQSVQNGIVPDYSSLISGRSNSFQQQSQDSSQGYRYPIPDIPFIIPSQFPVGPDTSQQIDNNYEQQLNIPDDQQTDKFDQGQNNIPDGSKPPVTYKPTPPPGYEEPFDNSDVVNTIHEYTYPKPIVDTVRPDNFSPTGYPDQRPTTNGYPINPTTPININPTGYPEHQQPEPPFEEPIIPPIVEESKSGYSYPHPKIPFDPTTSFDRRFTKN